MKWITDRYPSVVRPIRTVQFGEGNFLRAFIGDLWQSANNHGIPIGNIAVVKPRTAPEEEDPLAVFRKQQGIFTVLRRGRKDGKIVDEAHIIDCMPEFLYPDRDRDRVREIFCAPELRYIISNTTEAGITLMEEEPINTLAKSYPAKLTQLLYDRFTAFSGDHTRGLTILPMELMEQNGMTLRECVLTMANRWGLPDDFTAWIRDACVFVNTLVDRIVTGFPTDPAPIWDTLGYRDDAVTVCEPFFSLVLESKTENPALEMLQKAGLPVTITDNLVRYRERKVRILNGAHTGNVLCGILAGIPLVRTLVENVDCGSFLRQMVYHEILPHVPVDPRDPEGGRRFANDMLERFDNPHIDHRLLDISIESVEKWRVRILPSFRDAYCAAGKLPFCLTFSFAALLAFMTGTEQNGTIIGTRPNGTTYPIRDTHAPSFLTSCSLPSVEYVRQIAGNTELWREDMTTYPHFTETAAEMLCNIRQNPLAAIRKWRERA